MRNAQINWLLSAGLIFWQQMAQTYVKNFGIMACPSGDPGSKIVSYSGQYGSNRYIMRRRRSADAADSADKLNLEPNGRGLSWSKGVGSTRLMAHSGSRHDADRRFSLG